MSSKLTTKPQPLIPPIMLNHEIACRICGWTGLDKDLNEESGLTPLQECTCPYCGTKSELYGLDDESIRSKMGLEGWATKEELNNAHEEYTEEYKKIAINHIIKLITYYKERWKNCYL